MKTQVTIGKRDASEKRTEQEMGKNTSVQPVEKIQGYFKEAFRWHPAGTAIITANSPIGPVGLTATSVSSVSFDPPAVAFSLSALSSTAPAIREANSVVVHLLDSAGQELAKRFATSGIDRFENTSWTRLPSGEPLLEDAAAWFRGTIADTASIGGSAVLIVEIAEAGSREHRDGLPQHSREHNNPLVYCNRTWHSLNDNSVLP